MIFAEPNLDASDERVLELIRRQREQLRFVTQTNPRRWLGSIRRTTFARAIQGSNTIEGFNATLDEAIAAVEEEEPLDEKTETWLAINGYRAALTYIMRAAEDPYFELSKQFLKSIHFMMTQYDLKADPGRWRPGPIHVIDSRTEQIVYDAPEFELVDGLVEELVDSIRVEDHASTVVKAAMAHLNLTMIHPFRDGNGRMARAVQTLVLAREGLLHPLFSSIEEWLGRNTEEYYRILLEVGQGYWAPQNNALPWVRFCLKAHYQQANTLIRRMNEYEALIDIIDKLINKYSLHKRMTLPLFDCAIGVRLTNSRYQDEAEVSAYSAGRDLKILSAVGLIEPHGENRGRYYTAGAELKEARDKVRRQKVILDPYNLPEVAEPVPPRLPGF